jgi:hypothetical protein
MMSKKSVGLAARTEYRPQDSPGILPKTVAARMRVSGAGERLDQIVWTGHNPEVGRLSLHKLVCNTSLCIFDDSPHGENHILRLTNAKRRSNEGGG